MASVDELNLRDDYDECTTAPDAGRWCLVKEGPLEVWATVYPSSKPEEKFQARLFWDKYPDNAPSLKFRDPETGRLDLSRAWPVARGFRPNSLDACVNWTAEGFKLHPDWANSPTLRWDPRGNVLLKVLRTLVSELDDHFKGRST